MTIKVILCKNIIDKPNKGLTQVPCNSKLTYNDEDVFKEGSIFSKQPIQCVACGGLFLQGSMVAPEILGATVVKPEPIAIGSGVEKNNG